MGNSAKGRPQHITVFIQSSRTPEVGWIPSVKIVLSFEIKYRLNGTNLSTGEHNFTVQIRILSELAWCAEKQIGSSQSTAVVGRLSLSVGCENGPERGLKTVSFNP